MRQSSFLTPAGSGVWLTLALGLLLAPLLWRSSLAVTLLSQIGIAVIACMAYNLLLGQGGMLSFGHALYSGLGTYATVHALNAWTASRSAGAAWALLLPGPLGVALMPLLGGLAGLGAAALIGGPTTRRAGTPFAMITLGLGELVFALALMFPAVFGGEGGVSTNRVVGLSWLGLDWSASAQVYGLIVVYTLICTALLLAFSHTPLGRLLNAVRDNPQRVAFVGHNPQRVRHLALCVSGFFMGVAGGLAALLFELATPEALGAARSGGYLLFTVLGGSGYLGGPVLGGVLLVLAQVLLSAWTQAWLLYLGLVFVVMVLYAPGGLLSLLAPTGSAALTVWSHAALRPRARDVAVGTIALLATALLALIGISTLIEMLYQLQLNAASGSALRLWGVHWSVDGADGWCAASLLLLTGLGLGAVTLRHWHAQWLRLQADAAALSARQEST